MPFTVLTRAMRHPLTDSGLERFLQDWERYQAARDDRARAGART